MPVVSERPVSVPGWQKLRSADSERLLETVEVSDSIWEVYEGGAKPMPLPSVMYDFDRLLYEPSQRLHGGFLFSLEEREELPGFDELIDEFYEKALAAVRALTDPEEFIFALDCEYDGYLFWPHKAVSGESWPLRVPGPEAYWSFYAPADYSWGFFFADWYGAELFGQPLLDAFERNKPRLLAKIVKVDGVAVAEPQPLTELERKRQELQAAEDRAAEIIFRTELNYAACPEGPWTPELDRLYAEFERSHQRSDLARLIARVETILTEQGIEHTPCVSLEDSEAKSTKD
jgi:hypothetical protein